MMLLPLVVWRCRRCHRILGEFAFPPGSVARIKCACNAWNIHVEPAIQDSCQTLDNVAIVITV